MTVSSRRRLMTKALAAASLALSPLVAAPAYGTPRTWLVNSGSWGTSGNWTGSVVPQNTDDAFISDNDSQIRTASFRSSSDILSLHLGNLGSGNNILSHVTGTFTAASEEIGSTGRGQYDQLDGTNNITGSGANQALTLGVNSLDSGIYNLSGGSVNSSAAGGVIVGSLGVGTFKHSGGVHINSNGAVKLGDGVAAAGNYELSGGSVTAGAGGVLVGRLGMGTFIHSGGVHIVTTLGSALRLGADSGGSGFYQLSETGSLTATFETIGDNGAGNFHLICRTHVVNR